jgi:hypothetical protein
VVGVGGGEGRRTRCHRAALDASGPVASSRPLPAPAPLPQQAIRQGKREKLSFSAHVVPFKDPQGHDVVPTITGVLVNGAERVCTRNPLQGEKCVPDAIISPDGKNATLMPGISLTRNPPKLPGPGRVYLMRFTGYAPATGMSCTGYAAVCVVEQPRRLNGKLPPPCKPFPDAMVVRIATLCNNHTMSLADATAALDAAAP